MATDNLSQVYVEAASVPSSTTRDLSQVYVEAASRPSTTTRDLSQVYVEVLSPSTLTATRDLSQVYVEAASRPSTTTRDLSQVYVEALNQSPAKQALSQVYLEAASVPSQVTRNLSQVYVEAISVGHADQHTGLTVEIFVNGVWTDISPYVYYRDRVRITRGRADETSQVQPQTAALTINNRDGRFSPRNPVGPYYGTIGRNTQLRISRSANGIRWYRFWGEVPAWPVTWDISGTDVYVRIQAAGMLRRLNQGALPLRSAFYRVYAQGLNHVPQKPVAYWPCEDGTNATSIAAGLPGEAAMTLSGQALPTFGSNSDFPCSAPLPLLAASIWTGQIPAYSSGTANVLRFLLSVPPGGAFDTGTIASLYTTGTIARFDLQWGAAAGGGLQLSGYLANGTLYFNTGYISGNFAGKPVMISIEVVPSGPDLVYTIAYMPLLSLAGAFGVSFTLFTHTVPSISVGTATMVVVNPLGQLNDTAVGHVVFQSVVDPLGNVSEAFNAYTEDAPADRFTRLCSEQSVSAVVVGSAADDTQMGYQTIDTFPTLVQQVPDTSAGLLYEARDQLALALRTRVSLYNQAAKLTLDVSLHQLSGPLDPVDDDALTRNDVTATRINGSSAQQVLTSGTLSTQAPPNGVGDYSTNYSLSLASDAMLPDAAGWRLHMGTVDEPRYPQIKLNLRHSTFTSSATMMNAALGMDIGDRFAIVNLPSWLPPDAISQLLQGYSEDIGIFEHDMVLNASPESPFHAGILGDAVLGHLDTDGSTLAASYPLGTETSLSVATTGAGTGSPLWTTNAGDFPFDWDIAGERVTVTNITGSSSPQTATVIRSVNGVVKAQASGADVRLWQPMILSL